MRLFLLRHGKAEPYTTPDEIRQLIDVGRAQTAEIAEKHLTDIVWDAIWVSPFVRAQQTAQIVLDKIKKAQPDSRLKLTTVAGITPDDSPRKAMALLTGQEGKTILVVSHQPLLGSFAGLLIHGNLQSALDIPTSGLIELKLSEIGLGQAELIKTVWPS
ncbi:MAG TPA: phosphohistidine phosphatase SixA [Pseudomonadales bacterium]|nr:phosphohistidine phosphatase SixA [Pseudomonadales bacterium]